MTEKRLLAVEDDPDIWALLQMAAHEADYSSVVATSMDTFVEKIETFLPDIVVVNMTIPDVNGYCLIRRLSELNPDIPLVLIGKDDPVHLNVSEIIARRWGIDFVVTIGPPFELKRLYELLRPDDVSDRYDQAIGI